MEIKRRRTSFTTDSAKMGKLQASLLFRMNKMKTSSATFFKNKKNNNKIAEFRFRCDLTCPDSS